MIVVISGPRAATSRIHRSSSLVGRGNSALPGWSGSCRAMMQQVPAPPANGIRPNEGRTVGVLGRPAVVQVGAGPLDEHAEGGRIGIGRDGDEHRLLRWRIFTNRGRHWLHDADGPGVARHHLARPGPADPLVPALLHVPLARGVQAEVELLAVALALEEQLRLRHTRTQTPVRRSLALRGDPEAQDRALVTHADRPYRRPSDADHGFS